VSEIRRLLEAWESACRQGEPAALATVVSVEGSSYRRPGARMLVNARGETVGTVSAGCLERDVIEHAERVMRSGVPALLAYETAAGDDELAWGLGLGCGGTVRILVEPLARDSAYMAALQRAERAEDGDGEQVTTVYDGGVLVETLLPPVPLVIFGAGPDAVPLVRLARELGWRVEVVDPQARPASRTRFAEADRVTLARPDDFAAHVRTTTRTMAVVMSHDYGLDLASLRWLLASPARYVGVVGATHRTRRMLRALGLADDEHPPRLHAPAGLDIGAEGPTEIALSIVAELRAVLAGRDGAMLRGRSGTIHARPDELVASHERY
jgi:xanthine dehydrogenase accessory factor